MSPKQASVSQSKKKLNGVPVLSDHVEESINAYLDALNGTPTTDIYCMVLEQVEGPLLRAVLNHSDGNQSQAAEMLGISRGTLRKKLKHYRIEA